MRRFVLFFLSVWVVVLSLSAQEVDVFLIGGQSNATGQGYVRNIPAIFKVDTTVWFYYSRFLNQGEGGGQWTALCQASETRDKFGVELSLGTKLQSLYPERRIALIKHALSGSNLYKQWNPGNRPGDVRGEEYVKFVETVKNALVDLKKQGYRPIIRAMVWQQGEADARDIAGMDQSRRYGPNLKNFIEQVRKEFGCEDMLFVYGTVMPLAAPRFTGRELVKEAQAAIDEGSGSELSIKNALLIPADDLQMRCNDYKTPMPKDDVHLGTYGILTLGERFADAIYQKLK
ncbi:sialate O-acetylesterase [Parabacteroides sp. W1-Q-101]|uniref:sialate O-acetylesterase n=1 Tax=Parabacteroides TaxID=375288 RepID=UPI00202EDB1A|nr:MULTISPECIES: sialate O-acetylesterase [Parabacteroides]MCM0719632.1 sialate O-acetylesterase [Parabacteroides sp. W1-Q-101]